MKHTRTWLRLFAAAAVVTVIGAAAPVATADENVPEAESAVAPIEPLADGQEPTEEARQPFAAAAANGLPDAEWEYFRTVNVTRLQHSVDPVIRNGSLDSLAAAWARGQAQAGTTALDDNLASKLPAGWIDGAQAIYSVYAASPAQATTYAAQNFMSRDLVEATDSDIGLSMIETGSGSQKRYTIYQILVQYPHSIPQAGETTLYRFYKPTTGTHFYSTSAGERNTVIRDSAFRYEGQVAYVLKPGTTSAGTSALNRFYQPGSGTHFYTSSANEYNRVLTFPQYSLDGVAGKVYTGTGTGLVAMHRFFRPASGTHFYTTSESELASVTQTPGYTYEGVAFYLRRAS